MPSECLLSTQDKQTELLVLKSVILCLRELSEIEQLRRSWFETGETWSSFDELVCRLFDDSTLADSLASGEAFGSSVDEQLRDLRIRLSAYFPTHGPTLLEVSRAEWTDIARLAGALADQLEVGFAEPRK